MPKALNRVAIPQVAPGRCSPAHAAIFSQQREWEFPEGQAAIDAGVPSRELVELAHTRGEADGCTFNRALHTVQRAYPGIVQRFQIERRQARHAG